ncbi:MAG TPA: AAA family ATPase [Steroidobacteraceae bacterium]
MHTFRDVAPSLAANGYLPVPLLPRSKRPAIEDWTSYAFKAGDEQRYALCGAGLLTGVLAPVDVDVRNPELAARIERMAIESFGSCPRRVGNAPKVMLFYRTDVPIQKLRSVAVRLPSDAPGEKPHMVEVLGRGQQAAAFGIHPDTGKPFEWNGAGDPLEVSLAQLELVHETELLNFLKRVSELLLEHGTPVGSLGQAHAQRTPNDELAAYDATECRAAVAAIPNADLAYDDWITIGYAIKGALGDAGRDAWHAWSQKSKKYDERVTERAWRAMAPSRIGAGTLYRVAFAAGWNRERAPAVDVAELLGAKPAAKQDELLLDVAQLRTRVGPMRWIVKHAIPANCVGFLYGASGSFKSFIALDLALHVAHGLAWLGRKSRQGSVVYVAAEGGAGLLHRIDAWHQKRALDAARAALRVCIVPMMLDQPRDLARLSNAIAGAASDIGTPALIVLDTLSQTMAGDENEAKDMAAYLRGVGAGLRARFESTVIPIHHTGHQAADRPRGSSAIKGNADFLFQVERVEGAMSAVVTCIKQKDRDEGPQLPFELERLTVGQDEDGEEITSLVASYHDNVGAILGAPRRAKPRSVHVRTLIDLMQRGPTTKRVLRMDFYDKCGDLDYEAKKKAFYRAFQEIIEDGLGDEREGQAWLTEKGQT